MSKFTKQIRYKVVGFAGEEDWSEVPWVEILDKQIACYTYNT